MGFENSSWNISVFNLVIVAASSFEIQCGKTDTQTNRGKKPYHVTAADEDN